MPIAIVVAIVILLAVKRMRLCKSDGPTDGFAQDGTVNRTRAIDNAIYDDGAAIGVEYKTSDLTRVNRSSTDRRANISTSTSTSTSTNDDGDGSDLLATQYIKTSGDGAVYAVPMDDADGLAFVHGDFNSRQGQVGKGYVNGNIYNQILAEEAEAAGASGHGSARTVEMFPNPLYNTNA